MHYFLLFILIALLGGCGDGKSNTQPYIMGAKSPQQAAAHATQARTERLERTKVEAEAQKEIARINMQRDIELQKIRHETEMGKAGIEKEVAVAQNAALAQHQEKELEYSTTVLYVLLAVAAAVLLALLYFYHRHRSDKMRMHHEKLQAEMLIKEREIQAQMAEKLIDALAHGKLSAAQEEKLIDSLTGGTHEKRSLTQKL